MNWKDNLEKKATELNLKKEETNETKSVSKDRSIGGGSNNSSGIHTNASITNNIASSRSGNLFRGRIPEKTRELNKVIEKGGKGMITKEAALDDLEKLDVNAPIGKVIVEVGKILVKLLATIRSNQLLTEAEKVKIRVAKNLRDSKKEDKK